MKAREKRGRVEKTERLPRRAPNSAPPLPRVCRQLSLEKEDEKRDIIVPRKAWGLPSFAVPWKKRKGEASRPILKGDHGLLSSARGSRGRSRLVEPLRCLWRLLCVLVFGGEGVGRALMRAEKKGKKGGGDLDDYMVSNEKSIKKVCLERKRKVLPRTGRMHELFEKKIDTVERGRRRGGKRCSTDAQH